jgi:hypothetical protein
MFGSAFLGAHLMRGAAAAALLAWAIVHQTAHPWLSLGAGVAALSRYADARCAGLWAWSRRFRRAVAINDQIVVGVREPASRCRGWRATVDDDGKP